MDMCLQPAEPLSFLEVIDSQGTRIQVGSTPTSSFGESIANSPSLQWLFASSRSLSTAATYSDVESDGDNSHLPSLPDRLSSPSPDCAMRSQNDFQTRNPVMIIVRSDGMTGWMAELMNRRRAGSRIDAAAGDEKTRLTLIYEETGSSNRPGKVVLGGR